MWPVTQRFLDTLARTHTQLCYLEILKNNVPVATLQSGVITDPATGMPLSTIGGSVQVDKTTIRRSGSIQFVDKSGLLLPETVADLLAPFSTSIRVWSGVRYWDAPLAAAPGLQTDTEFVPVGTLVVTSLDSQYPQITVAGYDWMWYLGRFTTPYAVAAGTNIVDALTSLLTANVPTALFATNFPTSELTVPAQTFDAESSIADAAHTMANGVGWQLFCDPMGVFTALHEASTDDLAVLTYTPGQLSTMMRPKRNIGAEDPVNAVVYTGESTTALPPVRGYAQDNDPTSLTYVGAIGIRPFFASSPLITTVDQANLAARTTLARILGVSDTIVTPIVPNPALDCGDVIHVTDPTQQIDLNLIVDSFTVPLRASDGAQELTCRSRVIR